MLSVSEMVATLVREPASLAIAECVARGREPLYERANELLRAAGLQEASKAALKATIQALLRAGVLVERQDQYQLTKEGEAALDRAVDGSGVLIYL